MIDMIYQINHYFHNPNSLYQPAKDVRNQIEDARNKVTKFINARVKDKIIFGSQVK